MDQTEEYLEQQINNFTILSDEYFTILQNKIFELEKLKYEVSSLESYFKEYNSERIKFEKLLSEYKNNIQK